MTVAFAVGQMVGPAVGGWLADVTDTFRVPSVRRRRSCSLAGRRRSCS